MQPRVLSTTRWRDQTPILVWSRLGVEPAELSEVAVNPSMFYDLPGLLSPQNFEEINEIANKWGNAKL